MATAQASDPVVLQNGYLRAVLARDAAAIVELKADHSGSGHYGGNLLADGGVQLAPGTTSARTAGWMAERSGASSQSFRIALPTECGAATTVTVELRDREQSLRIAVAGPARPAVQLNLRQWFVLGQFRRGVVQSVAGQAAQFTASSQLERMYTIDRGNGSVALVPEASFAAQATLLSGEDGHTVGLRLEVPGSDAARRSVEDAWTALGKPAEAASCSTPQSTAFELYGNDEAFPAFASAPFAQDSAAQQNSDAYRIAEYATAAGVLGSYAEPGAAYPTLAFPKRSYGDSFDFFDPDAWPVVATLSWSGDVQLQREARAILARSEAGMLPDGQLPHHFEHGKPVYLSIAQSRQTGPNLFWTLACAEYASATGDEAWLHTHYSNMQRATQWILRRLDADKGLVEADGPLFIDVFRRSGFTLDTNAMSLHLLQVMADVADAEHDSSSAAQYRKTADEIREGLRKYLWDGHDHFITELHGDGTKRDFVDDDGNFAAIAFGALPDGRERKVLLQRLDSNPHLHPGGFGTWVSEKRYDKAECYGGNDGDSDVTMGRIWWLDELARVAVDDHATFDRTLATLRSDLLKNVWLYERYDADGRPTHNPYYHEYPEVLTMVLREMYYGLRITPSQVRIEPFGPREFSAHLGGTEVEYSPERVRVLIPGQSIRTYTIAGLLPGTQYRRDGHVLRSDAAGVVRFQAPAGRPVLLQAGRAGQR